MKLYRVWYWNGTSELCGTFPARHLAWEYINKMAAPQTTERDRYRIEEITPHEPTEIFLTLPDVNPNKPE